jgi:BlaI family transcriptional regulator, penicillinase repressor
MPPRRSRSAVPASRAPLGELELEVMLVVWERGECTSGDVIAAFEGKRELAASTIRNVLAKLRAKGYVRPVPSIGRGFLLRPTVAREDVARHTLKSVLASLFQGSPAQAIAYLLDDRDLSDADMRKIRRLLDTRKRKGGAS